MNNNESMHFNKVSILHLQWFISFKNLMLLNQLVFHYYFNFLEYNM
jgi:hypothetical protein